MNDKQLRIYLSHQISGLKGKDATLEERWINVEKFRKVGKELRAYFYDWEKMDGLPPIDLYVPADHEEPIQLSLTKKYMTVEQVLDIDCAILDTCNLLISWGMAHELSSGMKVELDYATKHNIPVYQMTGINEFSMEALYCVLNLILKGLA